MTSVLLVISKWPNIWSRGVGWTGQHRVRVHQRISPFASRNDPKQYRPLDSHKQDEEEEFDGCYLYRRETRGATSPLLGTRTQTWTQARNDIDHSCNRAKFQEVWDKCPFGEIWIKNNGSQGIFCTYIRGMGTRSVRGIFQWKSFNVCLRVDESVNICPQIHVYCVCLSKERSNSRIQM